MNPDDERNDEYRHREDYRANEDDERERRPRKKSSSTGSLLLIFGGIGCLVVLVCGGIIAYGVYKVMPLFKGITQGTVTAEQFFEDLKQNQIDKEYELTSKEFRGKLTRDQFAEKVKKNDTLVKHTSRSVNSANFVQVNDNKQLVITMTLHGPTGDKSCTMTLVEDQDNWKVNSLTIN